MEKNEYWKDMFDKLLEISSRKIADLETEKEKIETKLSESTLKEYLLNQKNTKI